MGQNPQKRSETEPQILSSFCNLERSLNSPFCILLTDLCSRLANLSNLMMRRGATTMLAAVGQMLCTSGRLFYTNETRCLITSSPDSLYSQCHTDHGTSFRHHTCCKAATDILLVAVQQCSSESLNATRCSVKVI